MKVLTADVGRRETYFSLLNRKLNFIFIELYSQDYLLILRCKFIKLLFYISERFLHIFSLKACVSHGKKYMPFWIIKCCKTEKKDNQKGYAWSFVIFGMWRDWVRLWQRRRKKIYFKNWVSKLFITHFIPLDRSTISIYVYSII